MAQLELMELLDPAEILVILEDQDLTDHLVHQVLLVNRELTVHQEPQEHQDYPVHPDPPAIQELKVSLDYLESTVLMDELEQLDSLDRQAIQDRLEPLVPLESLE